ncbi:M24 family metallopeptidase [Microbacterium schleiferi]
MKRMRILGLLDAIGQEALDLRSPSALAWYLEGARVTVSPVGDPVVAVRVDRLGDRVFVYANELERLVAEELPPGLDVTPVPWHRPLLDRSGAAQEAAFEHEVRAARTSLLPAELERYRGLCTDAARVVTEVASTARPKHTEREIAGRVAGSLASLGVEPLVVLVAGASRVLARHPLPTDARLGDRLMITVSARRHGMFTNLTRWVHFGKVDKVLADRLAALRRVEADAFAATRIGRNLSSVLADISTAYPRHGFSPDEWTRHHQGGPTGYAGRDPRATLETFDRLGAPQPFAWNPTAPGVKIEDTVLLSSSGLEVLTVDSRWPSLEVAGLDRPIALVP